MSTRAAVAVPAKMPAESPESTRPTNSAVMLSGTRNTALETAASTRPGSSTARRPTWSESRPNSSSAGDADRVRREDHLDHPPAEPELLLVDRVERRRQGRAEHRD